MNVLVSEALLCAVKEMGAMAKAAHTLLYTTYICEGEKVREDDEGGGGGGGGRGSQ